jgi:pimeloyl-ACP methyl ester carboxylesterase
MTAPNYQYVENENCKLRFWSEGSGPLLFFIPGGTAHSSQFRPISALLSSKYTCASFDRRGSQGSPTTSPNVISMPQQAGDVAAIVKALGFQKGIIFGNSLGGVLAFQVAIDHPEIIEHMVVHEAPMFMILPDSSQRFGRTLMLNSLFKAKGAEAATAAFTSVFEGVVVPGLEMPSQPPPENWQNFFENEFLLGSSYNPDWRKIIRNNVSLGVLAGKRSGDALPAASTIEQAAILGCPRAVVPGSHFGFEVEPDAFAPKLLEFVELLEANRKQKA